MNEKHTLEIDSVLLEFGTREILRDIWLKLETGRITGLLGRNGSGKSCLMKIMVGELECRDKSIRIDGHSLYGSKRDARQMMYLPQSNFLPGNLPLYRGFELFGVRYEDFLRDFPHFGQIALDSRIKYLSGGEQRILEVYLVLCAQTLFALLDEPFSQIMPVHVETFKKIIKRHRGNKGILISDHYYRDVLEISDRLFLLSEGINYRIRNLEDLRELGYIP